MVIKITDWSVMQGGDHYDAPEIRPTCVQGVVTGHPTKSDGSRVKTGRVVRAEGRRFWTASGNEYELGEANADFVKWLADQGLSLDPENPIKMRDS